MMALLTSVFCTSTSTPQEASTCDSSSTTSTALKNEDPAPPHWSVTSMPMMPRSKKAEMRSFDIIASWSICWNICSSSERRVSGAPVVISKVSAVMGASYRNGWCPGPDSNRHATFAAADFKSAASTDFATRAGDKGNTLTNGRGGVTLLMHKVRCTAAKALKALINGSEARSGEPALDPASDFSAVDQRLRAVVKGRRGDGRLQLV